MKVLVVDNYDSFVYILAQLVGSLGAQPMVFRNDKITLEEAKAMDADAIIISPGPGNPEERKYFGVCSDIIVEIGRSKPILGVCLGHQGIISTFGGKIVRAGRIMHGKTSLIEHSGDGIFQGVRNPLEATRYHSLVGERSSIPEVLKVTAVSKEDREVMGVRHVEYPIEGVQFHPESILTKDGTTIISNFLRIAKR